MQEFHRLTAAEAARAIASGQITSEALVRSCLDVVARRDPVIQAWAYLDPDYALAQARDADARRRAGHPAGPLHGVPIGIKDIIDTADMPTENGSSFFRGRQPTADATCVAALRMAGAVIMGKTVTTELATLTPPKTRNPRNPDHTPGGSSSGSAAAVAAGMIPAALATQTGGSVIRPASFCGIYGLKPTLGLISRTGVLLQSHSLDTVGVYGRSVEDLALLTDALSGYDPSDPVSYPRAPLRLAAIVHEAPPVRPRLAVVKSAAWDALDADAASVFGDFVRKLGTDCEAVDIPVLNDAIARHRIVQGAENAAYYGPLLERDRDAFTPGLQERVDAGGRLSVAAYIQALNSRHELCARVEDVLKRNTAIVMPAATGAAPAGHATTGNPICNGLWTYLGLPAVTLPLLDVNGLPLGVQLIGARREEARLLGTANWLVRHGPSAAPGPDQAMSAQASRA